VNQRLRHAAGFTLIELMISLTIGAAVTGTGLSLYLQMSKNSTLIKTELLLQENSYYIHQTLRQYVSQAGYRGLSSTPSSLPIVPVKEPEKAFLAVAGQWQSGEFIRVMDNGFAFRFEGSSDATGTADGSLVNCQGDAIAENEIAELQITIVDNALLCTSNSDAVELIGEDDGVLVEQFVLSWGVDTNDDNSIDVYRDASTAVSANENRLSVRVALLLSSLDQVSKGTAGYTFNGTDYASTDSRLRRESVTTVQIKH
jgi:prepilin-type N-terminal cleavage/methylation domain-containing protein